MVCICTFYCSYTNNVEVKLLVQLCKSFTNEQILIFLSNGQNTQSNNFFKKTAVGGVQSHLKFMKIIT